MASMPVKKAYGPRRRRFTKARRGGMLVRRFRTGRSTDFSSPSPNWYPFGNTRSAKLVYQEIFSIDPGASSPGVYAFRANGMYDPNYTSTGHQPYGFDQLMAAYNHYAVMGSRCIVTIIPGGQMGSIPFGLGIKTSDSGAINTTTPIYLMEQPGWDSKIFGNPNATNELSVAANYSTSKFNGGLSKREIMAKSSLVGNAAADPTDPAYFLICFFPVITAQDLPSITFHVRIEYQATFWGMQELPVS